MLTVMDDQVDVRQDIGVIEAHNRHHDDSLPNARNFSTDGTQGKDHDPIVGQRVPELPINNQRCLVVRLGVLNPPRCGSKRHSVGEWRLDSERPSSELPAVSEKDQGLSSAMDSVRKLLRLC